jgi:hypothetical protein
LFIVFQNETATFQLALISNGRLSYALIYYKRGAMRWKFDDHRRSNVVVGYSNGEGGFYESPDSNTENVFTSIDTTLGNTGR